MHNIYLFIVHKALLNYMAYIKIEVNKISDIQQQILEELSILKGENYTKNTNILFYIKLANIEC